jgi:hypothetical protein
MMRNVMVDSSIPVTEDQVGAIITLVKLAHERRGYADTQWHEIQAGYVGFGYYRPHLYEFSHADTLFGICMLLRRSIQIAEN